MQSIKNLLLAAIALTLGASFTEQEKTTVTVTVSGLRNNKGSVLASLYNDAKKFPKDAAKYAVGKGKATIVNGTATITFTDLPSGTYAVALLHDENNDLQMNTNMVGIPKEGFGFSNNAKGKFGPPAYNKASFTIKGKQAAIAIKMNYFL
jgi:uncharacterized protein (DUF2141 family)